MEIKFQFQFQNQNQIEAPFAEHLRVSNAVAFELR